MAPSIVPDHPGLDLAPGSDASQGPAKPSQRTMTAPYPNPSLQVTADHQLKQVEAPVLAPSRGEVLLHIKATGVCG
jgi:L-iditol 2-dehydrogenase